MHELSIAEAVVRIASDRAGDCRVTRVWVRAGALRQVVPEALRFAFELVAEGTPAAGAELEIEAVPATVRCEKCAGETVLVRFPAACALCGGLEVELIGGDELLVESLELEEPDEPAAAAAGAARAAGPQTQRREGRNG